MENPWKQNQKKSEILFRLYFRDFAHYEDTLRNNITVSDPERTSSDEELNQLLKELHVDAVINQQQLGLDSKIWKFFREQQ